MSIQSMDEAKRKIRLSLTDVDGIRHAVLDAARNGHPVAGLAGRLIQELGEVTAASRLQERVLSIYRAANEVPIEGDSLSERMAQSVWESAKCQLPAGREGSSPTRPSPSQTQAGSAWTRLLRWLTSRRSRIAQQNR